MEFHEKLQILRKQKGLTQEELAGHLFVSRTVISKWESARGYPNIDSLKAIAAFFGVTIDELLSNEELLTIAEEDNRETRFRFSDLLFGLADCSTAMFFFLPLFGQSANNTVAHVSLLSLTAAPYLKTAYFLAVIAATVLGICTLALQNCTHTFWTKHKYRFSLLCSVLGTLLFTLSRQPYAASSLLLFLVMKVLLLLKQP